MAQKNVNIGVNVSDNGTAKKVVKNINEIQAAAAAAQKATERLEAGTASSRAAAAAAAPKSQGMSGQEYGRARGTAGTTGASSRDFANQAQGLGGLVRVYATFAANLFAVSAAFSALKNAADTTSMIRGLEQLGAQGGRNLGALSLRIADLSDGAVSLREAMTATAQATAAGMSSRNLERLTTVAKTASQALGINMPDALSRLSRGVTKLEPELLDELGIFVKVDEAVTNYARSIGKTATGLTDFERRHAFAIAAIEQGEKKFGSIQLDANPYSKLLASVTNLAQTILETINKALGPLMEILSQSPKALGVALAGIAGILLKQAIPALGMYRENARALAEETRERVARSVKDQQAAASVMDAASAMRAEKAFQLEKTTQDRIAKLQKGRFSQDLLGKDLRTSLKKSAFDITPEETSALKARSQALLDSDNDTQRKQGAKLQAHLSKMEDLRRESAARGDAAAATNEAKDAKWYSHQQQMTKNLEKLNRDAAKSRLLAGVADTAAVLGPTAAFRELSAETKKLDAGPVSKSFVMLRGALSIAGSAATTALNAFGPLMLIFGLISTAIGGLISYLSNTAKESAETAKAFDAVTSSVENVTRTLEALAKKSPLERISVEGISARATAFGELAENIQLANMRAVAEFAKMGNTDQFVNWVSKLWNGDVQTKLNEVTAQGFAKAFATLERGPASDKLRESFKNSLGIDELDATSIKKALEKLPEELRKVRLDTLTKDLKAAALAAEVTAAKGKELTEAYAQSAKQLQDLRNSFLPTDAVSKLGMTIIDNAGKLDLALKDPVQTLNAMNAAVRDSNTLSLFAPESEKQLIALKVNVEALKQSYSLTSNEIDKAESKIALLNEEKANTTPTSGIFGSNLEKLEQINKELEQLKDRKEIKTKLLFDIQAQAMLEANKFDVILRDQFFYGAKLLSDKLSLEWAKAGNTIGAAIAGMLGDTEGGIRLRAKYETAALQVQMEQIKTQLKLIESNERLSIAIEQSSIDEQLKNGDKNDRLVLAPKQTALDNRRKILEGRITQGSTAKLAQSIKEGTLGAKESLGYVAAAESAFAAMANISAQMGVVAIRTAVDTAKLGMKTEQESLDRQADRLKLSKDNLGTLESIVGTESTIVNTLKQGIDQQQLKYDNDKKSYELRLQIAANEILLTKAKSDADKAAIETDIRTAKNKITELETTGKIAKTNLDNKQTIDNSNLAYALQVKEQEKLYARLQENQALESERLGMADMRLESAKQLNAIGEQGYLREKLSLDNDKARLETQTKIDQIRKGSNDITAGAEKVIGQAQVALKTADPATAQALNEAIRLQRQLIDETNVSSDKQVASLIAQLGLRTDINKSSMEQASAMQKVADATQSLASLFGELGTKIGGTVEALVKYSMGSAAMTKRHADSLLKMDKDSEAYKDKAKENAQEREKFEIDGEMNAAKVAKGLFKEKTAAYKILNNLEKIRAAQSIALSIKEAAIKLGLITEVQLASFAASAKELAMKANSALVSIGIDIPKIYAATIGQLGIFGPPVAAAMIAAFVGSAFGSKGGASFVPNSEQRQETQGTAMGYDKDGKKVQVRRGVFGDTDAKSESIAKSLETIRETSVDGLNYDNQMVKLLESIDRGINRTAKSLYSIEGLRSGSMFGTVQGTQSGGGFLGTGVFASKTTRTISDSGIIIEGTFAQLASDTNKAVIDFFEQVTVSKKSWYGKTKTWVETTRGEIDNATSQFFSEIFGNATMLLKEAGSKASISAATIDEILGAMNLKDYFISLRGLKGDDFQKELSAIISSILDDASSAIFSSFEKYAKFGEGMLETVSRVIDSNVKINQALKNTGSTFDVTKSYQKAVETIVTVGDKTEKIINMIGNTAFDISEALVENAGNLESFLSQAEFFRENFLTSAEQLTPITTAVNVELIRLSKLGFKAADGLVDTREEFKLLVQGLDLSTVSGRNAYQSLMNVQEGFVKMIDAAEEAAQKLKTSREDLFAQILSLTGTPAEILAVSRAKQLTDTAKELVPLQEYVYALEDIKSAEQALTKARDAELNKVKQQKTAIETTITSIKNYIESFKKFKDSLLLGSASPLTPTEKYAEAKKQFDAILATATGVAVTPEEERAKTAALGQLESASTAFLDASRTYNASSSKYIDDFNLVQKALTDSTKSLSDQLTAEEKSLAALNTQITLHEEQIAALNKLNDSTLSVAEAIRLLDLAKARLPSVTAATATANTAAANNNVLTSSLGGYIIGNQMYGLKGNTGIVLGANGGYEGTTNYMKMVERGEAQAKELRRIYVEDWGYDSKIFSRITGMSQADVLAWFKRMDPTLPTFATGTNFVPEDMLAQIHQGERIIPAADNVELMANMGDRNRTNEVLVSEIKKLNQKIDSLERAVAEGAIINADATNRNTVEVSRTVKDTGITTSHTEAIRRRTQVV